MSEHKYYCNNCGTEIKPTEIVCPKCGKKISEVGKRIVVTITDTLTISDSVSTQLTKKQVSIIKRIARAIKRVFAKFEIEFSFYPDGHISVTIRNRKET